jgi:hypothetical protein
MPRTLPCMNRREADATLPDRRWRGQVGRSGYPPVKTRPDRLVVQLIFPTQLQQWPKRPLLLDHGFVEPAPYILPPIPSGPLWVHEIKHDGFRSTMGHRWDRSARRVEKLRAGLLWRANDTVPIKPRGMHERTYQRILGTLAYHEAIRKRGASYARKDRPDQHSAHLWRQCRNRFAVLGGWPVR